MKHKLSYLIENYNRRIAKKHFLSYTLLYKFLILYLILILLNFNTTAQEYIKGAGSQNYTISDGLSQQIIRSISQDIYGYIWIGTEDGLNRFDGYEFKVYLPHHNDSTSISDNFIYSLSPSLDGGMWIGTNAKGLAKYNSSLDNFKNWQYNPNNINSISNNSIYCVIEDSIGDVWIGTSNGGVNHIETETNKITRYLYDPDNPSNTSTKGIYGIALDNNKLWIRTATDIKCLYIKTGEIKSFNTPGVITNVDNIGTFYLDKEGILWTSSPFELLRFDTKKEELKIIKLKNYTLYEQLLIEIEPHDDNHLWIGTNTGVLLVDKNDYSVTLFDPYESSQSLSDGFILSLYKDRTGSLWIGSSSSGINKLNLDIKKFLHYKHDSNNPNSINSNSIRALMVDSKDNIWVGLLAGGVDKINRKTNKVTHYWRNSEGPASIVKSFPTCFMEYSDGTTWVGTWGEGIFISPLTKNGNWKNLNITSIIDDTSSVSNIIQYMKTDKFGNIWIGKESGLTIYNPISGKYKNFYHNPNDTNSIASGGIQSNCIVEDVFGNNWIGTWGGITQMIPKDKNKNSLETDYTFIRHTNKPDDINTISDNRVISILYNEKFNPNEIFIGTYGGINRITLDESGFIKPKIKVYTRNDGLSNDVIFTMLNDYENKIWISTNNGISCFNPFNEQIKTYDKNDGLQGNQFFWGAACKSKKGELLFGGVNGFNLFYPKEIISNTLLPNIVFTDFKILNKHVKVGDKINNRIILEKGINQTDVIKLSHREKIFTFDFAALHYVFPDDNKYKYKMEGFDDNWVEVDSKKRTVSYTNLKHGEYTFRVKASNYDGTWTVKDKSIDIIITPPYWKTWWFRILFIAIIFILLYSTHIIRIRYLQRQKNALKKLVHERTLKLNELNTQLEEKYQETSQQKEEISAQNEELALHRNHLEELVTDRTNELIFAKEKAEESDRLKTSFLENMSHEIRTPLNALVGFSSFLEEPVLSQKERNNFIKQINISSDTLVSLIDNILDLSLIETGQLTISKETFSLYNLINELESYWQIPIKKKNLELKRNILTANDIKIHSDKFRVKQILSNFMSNAYKFTEKGFIEHGLEIQGNNLIFSIKDTGIGISKENAEIIFDRFTKIEEDKTKLYRGNGMGLAISFKLTEMLGGKIWVDSVINEGSCFYLSIPWKQIEESTENKSDYIEQDNKLAYNWSNKTFLICEDEETSYTYLSIILKKTKATVHWVDDGQKAVDMLQSDIKFDIILMDIKMPVMDGYEALKEIKKTNPNQVIIAQTAYATISDQQKIIKAGFDGYISKPIISKKLLDIMNNHM